jgi:hypothetical protein
METTQSRTESRMTGKPTVSLTAEEWDKVDGWMAAMIVMVQARNPESQVAVEVEAVRQQIVEQIAWTR